MICFIYHLNKLIIIKIKIKFIYVKDQEKVLQQQKVNRESEQERHWKQLQALRQAQAQQQQQVIQEQRAQGIARINRQMSVGDDNTSNLTIQLQVSTTQVLYNFFSL